MVRDTYSAGDLHVSKKEIRQKLKIILSLAGPGPSMYSHSGHAFDVAKAATTFCHIGRKTQNRRRSELRTIELISSVCRRPGGLL